MDYNPAYFHKIALTPHLIAEPTLPIVPMKAKAYKKIYRLDQREAYTQENGG